MEVWCGEAKWTDRPPLTWAAVAFPGDPTKAALPLGSVSRCECCLPLGCLILHISAKAAWEVCAQCRVRLPSPGEQKQEGKQLLLEARSVGLHSLSAPSLVPALPRRLLERTPSAALPPPPTGPGAQRGQDNQGLLCCFFPGLCSQEALVIREAAQVGRQLPKLRDCLAARLSTASWVQELRPQQGREKLVLLGVSYPGQVRNRRFGSGFAISCCGN